MSSECPSWFDSLWPEQEPVCMQDHCSIWLLDTAMDPIPPELQNFFGSE